MVMKLRPISGIDRGLGDFTTRVLLRPFSVGLGELFVRYLVLYWGGTQKLCVQRCKANDWVNYKYDTIL